MGGKRTSCSSNSMAKRKKLLHSKNERIQMNRERREVYVIGEGLSGQLGLKIDEVDHLTSVSGLRNENVIQVSGGGMHTLCLNDSGRVFSFGCNDQGALGRVTTDEDDWFNPSIVNQLQGYDVISVSCGDSHSSAIIDTGRLFIWGAFRLESGESHLIGPLSSSSVPVECFLPEKVIQVSSGNHHLLLLTESKQLLSIGAGERGQLGRIPEYLIERCGGRAKTLMFWPDSVIFAPETEDIESMWAGSYNSFARSTAGEIFAWGLNNYHQLGFKDIKTKFFPFPWRFEGVKVDVMEISGGDHHTLVLDKKGRIFSIGKGHYGQLGRGEADVCDKFYQVSTLSGVPCSSICAGLDVSYAVSCQGELYAWGQAGSHLGSTEKDLKFPKLMTCCRRVIKASTRGLHTIVLSVD